MVGTHGINPPYSVISENRSGKAERDSAPADMEPEENSRFPKIPGMRFPPAPLHTKKDVGIAPPGLPADLEAGSTTRGAVAGVTAGDNLHPERILALVVRGGAGLAQRIQAVLRRTRGCGGESRQLEDQHEPLSSSVRVRDTDGLSVVTLISVPARTLPELKVYSLPLRLRTTGC